MGRKSYNKKGLISQEGIKRRRHIYIISMAEMINNVSSIKNTYTRAVFPK